MTAVSSLKEIIIKESINFAITQEEFKHATIDLITEIRIKESNHVEKFYVEAIQNLDVSHEDLINYEKKKLIDFKVASEIKEQKDMLSRDNSYCTLVLVDFEHTPNVELLEGSMHGDLIPYENKWFGMSHIFLRCVLAWNWKRGGQLEEFNISWTLLT